MSVAVVLLVLRVLLVFVFDGRADQVHLCNGLREMHDDAYSFRQAAPESHLRK